MESDIENDLALLRALLARELETINSYRGLADDADGEAHEFLAHIIEEEKIHVADVLRAIAQLDPAQANLLTAGYAAGHAPGEVPKVAAKSAPAPAVEHSRDTLAPTAERPGATAPRMKALTVGSLRGMPQ